MQYEQDYIMRLIKQVIRALIGILLNKKSASYYIFPVNGKLKSGDDFLQRLTCGREFWRSQSVWDLLQWQMLFSLTLEEWKHHEKKQEETFL